MDDYIAENWQGMVEYRNLDEYSKIWQSIAKYGRVELSMVDYIAEYG